MVHAIALFVHIPSASRRCSCGAVGWRAFLAQVCAIEQHLVDVANHVVQAPEVWRKGADRRGALAVPAAATLPAVGPPEEEFVAPRPVRLGAGPRRVFPLGLARQTVAGTGLRGEPRRVGAGVRSGDVDHWPAPAAPAVVVRLVVSPAALRLQVAVVVVECHLVLGHGERRRDVHLAGRSLAPPTNGVCAAVAAHPEPPGRYDHHLGAAVAGAQNIPEGLLRGVPRGEAVRRQSRAEQGSHRQHGRPRNGRPR